MIRAPLRTSLLGALALVALSGCSLLGSKQDSPTTIYAPQVAVQIDPGWPHVPWSLVIAQPTAARIVDSPRMAVRPVPGELQVYKGAAWAQPATDMLQAAIQRTLEDSGRLAAVSSAEAGIIGDYRLVLDVRRFESDYAGGKAPAATIELNAKLVYNRDQRVVGARTFTQVQPAAGTGTDQVAHAFGLAIGQLASQVAGWVLTAPATAPPVPVARP